LGKNARRRKVRRRAVVVGDVVFGRVGDDIYSSVGFGGVEALDVISVSRL
jgi:hypothetical protein